MSRVEYDYSGERVLITGAAGLIGRTLVSRFAEVGAEVIAVDRDADRLAKTCEGVPRTTPVPGDLAEEAFADELFARIDRLGGLDVLLNNAAITTYRVPFADITADIWDEVMAANLRSVYLLSVRAVQRWLAAGRGGAIVSLSSPGASRAHEDQSAYDVTKAGIEAISRAIAVELGSHGIRANCIAPASVVGEPRPAVDLPSGRTTSPDQVADAALFLASPAAAQVNGHALFVDGGLLSRLRAEPEAD